MGIAEILVFGLIFCGLIYLYLKTKITWNWKRIGKLSLLTCTGIFTTATVIFFAVNYYNDYKDTHVVATEIAGMRLGQSYSSLVFENGGSYATFDIDDEGADAAPYWTNEATSKIAIIENDIIKHAGVFCDEKKYSLKGIYCGDNSEKIIAKFGDDIDVYCPKNEYVYVTKQKTNSDLNQEAEGEIEDGSPENSKEKNTSESKNESTYNATTETERDYVEEKRINGEKTIESLKEKSYLNKKLGFGFYLYENKVVSIKIGRLGEPLLKNKNYVLCKHK